MHDETASFALHHREGGLLGLPALSQDRVHGLPLLSYGPLVLLTLPLLAGGLTQHDHRLLPERPGHLLLRRLKCLTPLSQDVQDVIIGLTAPLFVFIAQLRSLLIKRS